MGKKEKVLVLGFVAALAATSSVAHYYVTREGYSMVARKSEARKADRAASRQRAREEKKEQQQQQQQRTPGGMWGNMAKRRDAISKD